jgi:hypothetical protein
MCNNSIQIAIASLYTFLEPAIEQFIIGRIDNSRNTHVLDLQLNNVIGRIDDSKCMRIFSWCKLYS